MKYNVVVIGASAGGMEALRIILSGLESDFAFPVVIVQHVSPHSNNYMITYLDTYTSLIVKEAEEKEQLQQGKVYVCPPNYHLLLEDDCTLSLGNFEKVNYSRPSIDVLFETAAIACRRKTIGVLLTGASSDGAYGMSMIHSFGGLTLVQDPETAYVPFMPESAIKATPIDYVLSLEDIASYLNTLSRTLLKM